MQYEILLCYYLGKRYEEVDATFSQSALSGVDAHFPAYRDLLVILYDTYQQLGDQEKTQHILDLMRQTDPVVYEGLHLSTTLQKADLSTLRCWDTNSPLAPCVSRF